MPITQTQIETYNDLQAEKAELEIELKRIDGFFARPTDNRDNARAINAGKVFVKFAGTACMLPEGIFTAELKKRKKEIETQLVTLQAQLDTL